MNHRIWPSLAVVAAFIGLASAAVAGDFKGPYFGQRLPGETPEIFAPEFLSARYGFVARIAFSPEGAECFFTVPDATFSHPKIYGTRKVGDTWSEPAIPAFADPRWNNLEPFFSRDGAKLYFISNRAAQPATNKKDIWVVERTSGGWSEPRRLPPPFNSDYADSYFSQAADGTAYFCSNRPNGMGVNDLYRVCPGADPAAPAENLGAPLNTKYYTLDPCIAPDKSYLVFAAVRPEGRGHTDLYISFADGSDGWTAPVNLGEGFNTAADEYAPVLSQDERFLFFTRHAGTRADLYWVKSSVLERFRPKASPVSQKSFKGPYFGQRLPGETPVLFAPEVLSSVSPWVEATEFSPDGTQFFLSVGDATYSSAKLFYSKRVNDSWTPFVEAPFISDFTYSNEPVFSADGRTLTFTGKKAPSPTTDFWTVAYMDHGWSAPVRMPEPFNSGANEWRGSTMSDGAMYFGSERDKAGIYQVFKATLDAGRKPIVEKLGPPINMNTYDGDPCIAPDGRFMVLSSGREGNNADLYVSFRDGKGGWGTPINLGADYNSVYPEYGAHLSADGKTMFFTRHMPKENKIFWVAVSAIDKLNPDKPAGPKGPYFGQRFPGEIPEAFAPEFLSARFGFVARTVFSPDGNECFFTVSDATFAHPKIYGSRKVGDTWSEPAIPSFADPQWINHEPFFSRDGNKVFFTSNRQTQAAANKRDFWVSDRTSTGWSEPRRLPPPINSDQTEFFYSQTADGTAYFCSNRPNGIGALDIYRVRPGSDPAAPAENLGAPVNSKYYNGDPCIAPDGRFLVFGAVRPEGRGGMDLYVTFVDGANGWTAPVNLGEGFSTPANEYAPSLSPDGRFLFFSRHDGRRAVLHWVRASVLERFRQPAPLPANKKEAYLAQTPPGDTPVVFAPGVVSLENRLETYPTFSPEGQEMFFSVVNAAWTAGEILHTRLKDGVWTKPEKAPFSANPNINWESFMSPDGKRMFFSSNRPPSAPAHIDLWMVERKSAASWSDPVRLPDPINSDADDGSACVTNDGTLYFHSTRGGGIGGSELYRARLIDNKYSQVENLGGVIKTGPKESEPFMAPDENCLIFISQTRPGGKGGWDLWICFKNTDGSWSTPVNMGPEINTAADEYGPRLTPDGKYLFFTRETRGKTMDIYWVSALIVDRLRMGRN